MSIIEKAIGRFGDLAKNQKGQRRIKRRSKAEVSVDDTQVEMPEEEFEESFPEPQVDHSELEPLHYQECLSKAGYMAPADQLQRSIDEYRRIKRPLIQNAFGKTKHLIDNGRLIAVTSSIPGEGKTFSCLNLALSLARERDYSVLLVDADVTKASTSRVIGLERAPGLMEILQSGTSDIKKYLVHTDLKNLSVLTCGLKNEHSTELLASDAMRDLTNKLLNDDPNRIVLLDAPPLLATSEAAVVASHAGQIALVVEAIKTPKNVVKQSLQTLNIDEGKAVGFILNKTHRSLGLDYYGYYNDYNQE